MVALAAAGTAAAGVARVGVIVTVQVNLEPGDAERVSALIGDALAGRLEVEVVAGDDVTRQLPPGGVPDDCLTDPACLHDLGARLRTDQLLLVVAVKVGDRLQLDPTWAEVASGRTLPRPSIEIGATLDAAARAALFAAATRLLPDAQHRAAAVATRVPAEPVARVRVASIRPGRHMTRAAWVAAGISAAALVSGIGFGTAALVKQAALEDDGCSEQSPCPDGAASLRRRALAADLFLAGAAIAAGVGGYLFWTSDRPRLAIEAHRDGASLSVAGRF